jgi:hypothetical protein
MQGDEARATDPGPAPAPFRRNSDRKRESDIDREHWQTPATND